ncbi:RAMP superfamily CRISPR-associated protein [Streptobacillus canis]|uniref:RAMP superfamily CRISPR-associated protein n=1 Tax=Streptobacillus canis TaxID=2678686 RepID=UPI0018CC4A5D|nr:RAMP superfamily CRISPR-associated protein [Streptobacillus canis]
MKKIEYVIKLDRGFITSQNGVVGKEIDYTVKVNGEGIPIIYGKHIKGIIRGIYESFLYVDKYKNCLKANELFGSEGIEISKIYFSNLEIDEKKYDVMRRHSVKINPETRTAKEGSLFNYEYIKEGNTFTGEVLIKEDIDELTEELLIGSIRNMDKIGGLKSRGIGHISVEILKIQKIEEEKLMDLGEFKWFDLDLNFVSPLVLEETKITNVSHSRKNLQGSSIRGALIQKGLEKLNGNISNLLDIEVRLVNNKIKLRSEFKPKYRIGGINNVDKSINPKDNKYFNSENGGDIGNKFTRSSATDFEKITDEISIKINNSTRIAEEEMLFNHEIIENKDLNGLYNLKAYIPEKLLTKVEEKNEIYVGKFKSKGFGKIILKVNDENKIKENNIETRIKEFNQKVKKYEKNLDSILTFDLLSDLVLPFQKTEDLLREFLKMLPKELNSNLEGLNERSFIFLDKLKGYNIINNTRKADELIILKGSVLTYKVLNLDKEVIEVLKTIEEKGLGLRRKEGFGIISICTKTDVRGEM